MAEPRNPFVEALSVHDVPTLREAFDRVNASFAADARLHRTCLLYTSPSPRDA